MACYGLAFNCASQSPWHQTTLKFAFVPTYVYKFVFVFCSYVSDMCMPVHLYMFVSVCICVCITSKMICMISIL